MTAFLSAAWPRVRQLVWRVGTHVSLWSRVPTRMDKRIQLDRTTAGGARCAYVRCVGWKRNIDGRVAPKGRTRYFLFQPSLPLIQATLVRGAFVFIARVRPACHALRDCSNA